MVLIDIPTVYLTVGALYLFIPLTSWLALSKQPSPSTHLWCSGSMVFGLSLVFVGLRNQVPEWVSYTLANGMNWTALMVMVLGLRRELDPKDQPKLMWSVESMLLSIVGAIALYEYFRLILEDPFLRFEWAIMNLFGWFIYIAWIADKIANQQKLRSARWLSGVFIFATLLVMIRFIRVAIGAAEPDASAQQIDTVMTVCAGLSTSIFGNFAMVAMVLERAHQVNVDSAAKAARDEESRRLGAQIEQLERQRTLGAMSASFAHELSQPMTAILMDIESIKNNLDQDQKNEASAGTSAGTSVRNILSSVEDIQKSAEHTVQLISRIRNFIRPTENIFERVDITQLVRDVLLLLTYEIRKHNVRFEFELTDEPCSVQGDRVQLSQILLNVYRNAIQAVQDRNARWVRVTLEVQAKRVVLRVFDSGAGVSTNLIGKVGQPFVTNKVDGLGVGLSISSAIAEKHDGSLTITNAVDGGAVVELNLSIFPE
jgi:C4-dicarboxylate-specific signal transduction histidine kinase